MQVSLFVLSVFLAVSHCVPSKQEVYNRVLEAALEDKPRDGGVHWAVLVAGSRSWMNYRHQADVCHAYQILKKHGIPDERIIVMMYDDIAHNDENPDEGNIINRPAGSDVYHGVPKDYTGMDVTPKNFLKVLKGEEGVLEKKKVLKSGPNDHVFVNFVDHGAPGIVAFPHDYLHAKDWIKAIEDMHKKDMYSKMVIYLEACESGSMFQNLLDKDLNVFAVTAANAKESSYACYYDKARRTYLGDLFSVNWMENSDAGDLATETLQKQYSVVREETNRSHVMEFGDMAMKDDPLLQYQGGVNAPDNLKPIYYAPIVKDSIPAPDVPLVVLERRLEGATDVEEQRSLIRQLEQLQKERTAVRTTVKHIAGLATFDHVQTNRVLTSRHDLTKHECYAETLAHFHQHCFNINEVEYAMRHVYVLVNLCEENIPAQTTLSVMSKVCF